MNISLREARKAEKERDFLRAGDLFTVAGDEIAAIKCYQEGGHFLHAARLLEKHDNIRGAAQCYARGENFERAAILYTRLNDYLRASSMFEKAGDLARASEMAELANRMDRAAEMADKAEKWERAAALYVKVQNFARAADIYYQLMERLFAEETFLESVFEKAKRFALIAATLYERLQNYEKAAYCYDRADRKTKAADCFKMAGQAKKAVDLYVEAENFKDAASVLENTGKFIKASELAEKGKDYEKAAGLAEKSNDLVRAATLYAQGSQLNKAADIYFRLITDIIEDPRKNKLAESKLILQKHANSAGALYQRIGNFPKAAWCYAQAGSYARAAECYLRANNLTKAGEMFYRSKNYEKAYELLVSKSGDPPDNEVLADLCFYLGKYTEAGDLYVATGQTEKAAAAYEKAEKLYKAALLYESINNHQHVAELYSRLNEPRKAAEHFEKANNYPEAASHFEHSGHFDKAIECYLLANNKFHAAELMVKQNDIQRAITTLQEMNPDREQISAVAFLLGDLFLRMGMDSLAAKKFKEVLGNTVVTKDNLEAYYNLGVAYQNLLQYSVAIDIFEKILSLQFGYKDVMERLDSLKRKPEQPAAAASAPQQNAAAGSAASAKDPSITREIPVELVGQRIREYELLEILGRGGMGTVYRARHVYLNKERAIKIIENKLNELAFTERFIREARILSDMHHPNLVQLYEFGSLEKNSFFMVLELIQGESVKQRIARLGKIPPRDAIRIVREAALGLHFAHESGIIHRDTSPDNLMLVKGSNNQEVTKVIDFGIAKALLDETKHTMHGMFIGKPEYASPEQCGFLREGETIDRRSDLYSLAITFYHMLVGSTPFYAPNPQAYLVKHITQEPKLLGEQLPEMNPSQTRALQLVIFKAIAKNRQDRHPTMLEFVEDLESVGI